MYYYVFDGSFCGFLSVLFDIHFFRRAAASIVVDRPYRMAYWNDVLRVSANTAKAGQMAEEIRRTLGSADYSRLYHAFLGDKSDTPWKIYQYLQPLLSSQPAPLGMPKQLQNLCQQVEAEAGELIKEIRFFAMDSHWQYAPIAPKADVLELLALHFFGQEQNQAWIIHDWRRQRVAVCGGKSWQMMDIPMPAQDWPQQPQELMAQAMWNLYFRDAALAKSLKKPTSAGKRVWSWLT